MADPILIFPRVIYKDIDPTSADDVTMGYIDGNFWINKSTGKAFICVDSANGGWVTMLTSGGTGTGGDFAFGDGSDSNVNFDLGDGDLLISAENADLDVNGDLNLKGSDFTLNKDRQPVAVTNFIARDEDPMMDGILRYDHMKDEWQAGEHNNVNPIVTTKLETRDPAPEDNWDTGHYLGMTWINKVTRQKFTCVSCPQDGSLAVWVLALSQAPVTFNVTQSDFLILYNDLEGKYSKISYNNFMDFVADSMGGISPGIANYAWQEDSSDNLTPSIEADATIGLLRTDVNGDVMPLDAPNTDTDEYFELDGNDDVMPKEVT